MPLLTSSMRLKPKSEAEIVETLAHVGLNLFTNYFNHVANTEIDFPFVTAAATNSAA